MQKVLPGHEVLSLFGMAAPAQALNKKIVNNGLAMSLISAFFIILAVSLILSAADRILATRSPVAAVIAIEEEKTAFIPGQFISAEISRGYTGSYR